ncbi:MAG: hypothetical protein ACO3S0_14255, partial [bacterium]
RKITSDTERSAGGGFGAGGGGVGLGFGATRTGVGGGGGASSFCTGGCFFGTRKKFVPWASNIPGNHRPKSNSRQQRFQQSNNMQ